MLSAPAQSPIPGATAWQTHIGNGPEVQHTTPPDKGPSTQRMERPPTCGRSLRCRPLAAMRYSSLSDFGSNRTTRPGVRRSNVAGVLVLAPPLASASCGDGCARPCATCGQDGSLVFSDPCMRLARSGQIVIPACMQDAVAQRPARNNLCHAPRSTPTPQHTHPAPSPPPGSPPASAVPPAPHHGSLLLHPVQGQLQLLFDGPNGPGHQLGQSEGGPRPR